MHVVAAVDTEAHICHVITAYRPGLDRFEGGLPTKEEAMTGNSERCALCGGEKRTGTMTFAVDLKFGVVVVRDVPAFVCETYGDAWIDDLVAEKL